MGGFRIYKLEPVFNNPQRFTGTLLLKETGVRIVISAKAGMTGHVSFFN
jgi:hypothetical protein